MIVYDCDDPDQYSELADRVQGEYLTERLMVQSFAPDTLDEARNRGFWGP